jgi:hypothetical protein
MNKLFLGLAISGVLLSGCNNQHGKEPIPVVHEDKYVFEEYTIMIVDDTGKIYGQTLDDKNGIFLEEEFYKDYPAMYDIRPGDKIEVVYDAAEFSEGVYDNPLGVEIK